ncbi:ATP-binding protein [Ruegeria sp.]|uniref:ATP-binding protein n=1 Tax=Ruegeria sp. TaxID=1879320 RepID=UPI003B5AFCC6
MLSLRERALLGGVASGAVSVAIGLIAVLSYINSRVLDRFDEALEDRHTQLVVGLSVTTQNPAALGDLLFDPDYSTPYSGRYWQVTNSTGDVYTSASLFDETLAEPRSISDGPVIWDTMGPGDEIVRSAFQEITYEDGTVWGVSVAENKEQLLVERRVAQRSLMPVFALVGLIGVASSLLLMSAIIGPLRTLRADVSHRWERDEDLKPENYPGEVSPLVTDLNQLLLRNREIIAGSRRQTADLAHSLKTPATILRNELLNLSDSGASTDVAQEALDRIDAQIGRSLARMRAANSAELTHSRTNLSQSINRLSRLFLIMAEREGKLFSVTSPKDVWIRMDTQDIEEVIGNLLDNAFKWCRKSVKLSAEIHEDGIVIRVEDDGPGIPEEARREALRSGGRLDTSVAGTGLGLAIAVDLLNAYGAKLSLDTSRSLGGLEVRVVLPPKGVAKTLASDMS